MLIHAFKGFLSWLQILNWLTRLLGSVELLGHQGFGLGFGDSASARAEQSPLGLVGLFLGAWEQVLLCELPDGRGRGGNDGDSMRR